MFNLIFSIIFCSICRIDSYPFGGQYDYDEYSTHSEEYDPFANFKIGLEDDYNDQGSKLIIIITIIIIILLLSLSLLLL